MSPALAGGFLTTAPPGKHPPFIYPLIIIMNSKIPIFFEQLISHYRTCLAAEIGPDLANESPIKLAPVSFRHAPSFFLF